MPLTSVLPACLPGCVRGGWIRADAGWLGRLHYESIAKTIAETTIIKQQKKVRGGLQESAGLN